MKIHSMVDVITNSSSVVYAWPAKGWEKNAQAFLAQILKGAGCDVNVKDVFDIEVRLSEDYWEYKSYWILDDFEDGEETDDSVELNIAIKSLAEQNMTVAQYTGLEYGEKRKLDTKMDINGKMSKAFQAGKIDLSGDDGMFSDQRYSYVVIKSKITGEEINLYDAMVTILEIEGGNDNY